MKLSELAGEPVSPDPVIAGLAVDSRRVEAGFLFAALAGEQADGAAFIPQAERNGAAAILTAMRADTSLPQIVDARPRRRLAAMAARFTPRRPERIFAVTGTNGKTSTAWFAAQISDAIGRRAASLGTLGARFCGRIIETGMTTPEPIALHRLLDDMARAGVEDLAMEASSHALAQSRVDGLVVQAAGFTNISRDHLDYHNTFEDYFAAKAKLFAELLAPDAPAIVNADGVGAERLMNFLRAEDIAFETTGRGGRFVRVESVTPSASGMTLAVRIDDARRTVRPALFGAFQAENLALAAGLVRAGGGSPGALLEALEHVKGAPGRMERVAQCAGASVFVDYAHSPDAIAAALDAARPHAREGGGRVIALIGAGGDRDREKRPLMGAAAADRAELVIVTDDNPRSEDPAAIRRQVAAGAASAVEIADRREAIAHGLGSCRRGDLFVILGKGHETGQIIGDETFAFNDAAIAREIAQSLVASPS